jgi:hypothetical protein
MPADLVSDNWEKLDGAYEWIKTGCGKAGSATMGKPDKVYLPFNVKNGNLCGWKDGKYAKLEFVKTDKGESCNKNGSTIMLREYDSTTKCTGMPSNNKEYKWGVDLYPGKKRNECVDGNGESVYLSCGSGSSTTAAPSSGSGSSTTAAPSSGSGSSTTAAPSVSIGANRSPTKMYAFIAILLMGFLIN